MPRFLRLGNQMIHIPSVSSVTIGTTCLGRPLLRLSYHITKKVESVYYKNWEECQRDFNRIKTALTEVEALLEKIGLTEPEARIIAREQALADTVDKVMSKTKDGLDQIDMMVKEGVKELEEKQ